MIIADSHWVGLSILAFVQLGKKVSLYENGFMLQENEILDTSGLLCPEPVMMLHNAIRDIATGLVLKVIATDPSTQKDIPKFCSFLGHELIEQQQCDNSYIYFIRKL